MCERKLYWGTPGPQLTISQVQEGIEALGKALAASYVKEDKSKRKKYLTPLERYAELTRIKVRK